MNKHFSDYSMGYDDGAKDCRKEIERLTADNEMLRDELEQQYARVETLEAVVDAAKIFLAQHDSGDDATSELELLDEALAALESDDE